MFYPVLYPSTLPGYYEQVPCLEHQSRGMHLLVDLSEKSLQLQKEYARRRLQTVQGRNATCTWESCWGRGRDCGRNDSAVEKPPEGKTYAGLSMLHFFGYASSQSWVHVSRRWFKKLFARFLHMHKHAVHPNLNTILHVIPVGFSISHCVFIVLIPK